MKRVYACAQTTPPDCLILDFYLPDMDGFEFLDALQGETVFLPYPVVMLTGRGSEQLAVQAMHRGGTGLCGQRGSTRLTPCAVSLPMR